MGIKKKELQPVLVACPNCGAENPAHAFLRCVICRVEFCVHCAIRGYGREFCSSVCREYFFHGDADDFGVEE